MPECNIELSSYSQFFNQDHIQDVVANHDQRSERNSEIICTGGYVFGSKAKASRGVLNELRSLAKQKQFSAPLKALLGNKEIKSKSLKDIIDPVMVSASLSDAQLQIVHSSSINTLTRVIGPPGTGKSFTAAAIASHFFAEGQSVLIISRNEEAVEVVTKKIEEELRLTNLVAKQQKAPCAHNFAAGSNASSPTLVFHLLIPTRID